MVSGNNNIIETGTNIDLTTDIVGNNNTIIIKDAARQSNIKLYLRGDNNKITIDSPIQLKDLKIVIGSHVLANNTTITIGKNLSTEPNVTFLLYDSKNKLCIGENCMFSNTITIRCGELPHLIFSLNGSKYTGFSEGVFIGNHVWIGEHSYINKRVTIPDENIVAACSVVTKRFTEKHCAIGGNPAKVVKKKVQWFRNESFLEKDSDFYKSFRKIHYSE